MNASLASSRAQFQSAVDSLRMQVDRDTVLQARAALLEETLRLRRALLVHASDEGIGLCGGDPISPVAAQAFNERIGALLEHCRRYTDDLETAGHTLGEIARRYGHTEDDIARSFTIDTISPR
ncbi:hypothetical protein ACFQE5_17460 [Pseudonocardia hispaniensis]|uniref:PE family protein n=1 Tax=Pseudonocardia hispaniensis TaxID=904933 RepID=A0ABW1J568_9PSEU